MSASGHFLFMVVNKILCVAEKPSISKSVAQILSGGVFDTKSTKNKFIKNYEFNSNHEGRNCKVTMTCLLGHLMDLEFTPEFRNWNNQTTDQLFTAPVVRKVKESMADLSQNIEKLCRSTQMLVIWTDCDLEGENIGSEVADVCRKINPRIIVKRARFAVIQQRCQNN